MVKTFVITELISLSCFYAFSHWLIGYFDTEGVVIAHFLRYIVYLGMVVIGLSVYFKNQKTKVS